MQTIDMQQVDSSQIQAIGYDAETHTLAIQFKAKSGEGSLYHYANVTQATFDALRTAESLGAFFGKHIKPYPDLFPFVKVKEAA